jgi:hypothetical protein
MERLGLLESKGLAGRVRPNDASKLGQSMVQVTMGEPEPERRRQTKQKLRRTQGAGIWPEAVPRTEGQIRRMTYLDAPRQFFVGAAEDRDQPEEPPAYGQCLWNRTGKEA